MPSSNPPNRQLSSDASIPAASDTTSNRSICSSRLSNLLAFCIHPLFPTNDSSNPVTISVRYRPLPASHLGARFMEGATVRHQLHTDVTQSSTKYNTGADSASVSIQDASPISTSSESSLPDHTRDQSQSQSGGDSDPSDSDPSVERQGRRRQKLERPKLGSRKSSGTIIIPREQSPVAQDEHYDDDDARAMSPRRTEKEISEMGEQARQALEEYAEHHCCDRYVRISN